LILKSRKPNESSKDMLVEACYCLCILVVFGLVNDYANQPPL
jgi:hypothetical protein